MKSLKSKINEALKVKIEVKLHLVTKIHFMESITVKKQRKSHRNIVKAKSQAIKEKF